MDDLIGEPHCPTCGTVLYLLRGGYECRWCGLVYVDSIPSRLDEWPNHE